MKRMAIAIRAWQDSLLGVNADSVVDTMDTTISSPQMPHKLGGTPAMQVGGTVAVDNSCLSHYMSVHGIALTEESTTTNVYE